MRTPHSCSPGPRAAMWLESADEVRMRQSTNKNGDISKRGWRSPGEACFVCLLSCADALFAVSLGRRIPAVQHGAGGDPLVSQHSVHPLLLANLHRQLCAVNREEPVRQLRSGDPGQILAQGESMTRKELSCLLYLKCLYQDARAVVRLLQTNWRVSC